jgi:hypothetical protein
MCLPCAKCGAQGRDNAKIYDLNTLFEELRCHDCDGRGFNYRYMSLDELYQLLMPYMLDEFQRQMPEILAQAKFELVRDIMDS